MAKITTGAQLAAEAKKVAQNYKTLYVMGCFGSPMNAANKDRYCKNNPYNTQASRTKMIKAASADTFGFDCVCLIKGLLWGWSGDKSKTYGGATYATNGVPDIGADEMIAKCKNVSTNFSSIAVGEAVWCKGHIGIYIGNGLAVECTPAWKNCVQITAVRNIGAKSGYNARTWTKHGKLPYVSYEATATSSAAASSKKSVAELAQEVLDGKWGNGEDRKRRLTEAGYSYSAVQAKVDELCKKPAQKTVDQLAQEVLDGKWGNGTDRKNKLTQAGYDYAAVQKKVDELCSKKTVAQIAQEVIDGKWGNGEARKAALKKAGYNYSDVQAKVNELCNAKSYQCIHTVKSGESLWLLATRYLGSGNRYTEIMKLNGKKTTALSVGENLKIPKK